jgi:uncharacterized membrane protein
VRFTLDVWNIDGRLEDMREKRPAIARPPLTSDTVMTNPNNPTIADSPNGPRKGHKVQTVARCALAALLMSAGASHLSWARNSFQAQVPDWIPVDTDAVVLLSGVVEIGLGAALLGIRRKWIGLVVGAFFVAVFPGNISQYVKHRDAFGLDTDTRRFVRLLFQPVLVAWAVWSTKSAES